jgi:hypothetical protein
VFTLYANGWCSLNRGYLTDSGAFRTDEAVSELDATIDACFPGNQRAAKPYFTTIPAPTEAGTKSFTQWLIGWLDGKSWEKDVILS